MCLIALAIDCDRRFPLVVAANRDEFFDRPAARLGWWSPGPGQPDVLSGRDLRSGGTWLGLTAQGRLALLTNVRLPSHIDPQAPSRGQIVPDWLSAAQPTDRFWMRTALMGHNPFNLVAADFRRGESFWASNTSAHPVRLERGVYGVSNASLDTPWPKVSGLKSVLKQALSSAASLDVLSSRLFDALADRSTPPDADLPSTGVPLDTERMLASAFIRSPDMRYGTRCSTLIITERTKRHLVTHVLERSFSGIGGVALLRRATLKDWPPRYTDAQTFSPRENEPVSETELPADAHADTAEKLVKRTRVRSLLKPEPKRKRRA